ncbi:FHA domain-containing protein [Saccharopolyspora dendranthemae]|nr:FHA domain-containing protein [Saccharopolyspora dendranthemae]
MGQIAEVAGLLGEPTLHVTGRELPVAGPHPELIPAQRESAETMRLVVGRGPDAGAELAISAPLTAIGRHRDCDIVIEDVTVSRYHAELEVEGDRCFLVDGGSLNGTFVNRRAVDRVELVEGDEIWIGKARFLFRSGAAADARAASPR